MVKVAESHGPERQQSSCQHCKSGLSFWSYRASVSRGKGNGDWAKKKKTNIYCGKGNWKSWVSNLKRLLSPMQFFFLVGYCFIFIFWVEVAASKKSHLKYIQISVFYSTKFLNTLLSSNYSHSNYNQAKHILPNPLLPEFFL